MFALKKKDMQLPIANQLNDFRYLNTENKLVGVFGWDHEFE